MPTQPKHTDNMAKHMTDSERAARAAADAVTIPDRGGSVNLEQPAIMVGNATARKYWANILKRMDGLVILDDLDSDALGLYCVMMSRYEVQSRLFKKAVSELQKAKGDAEKVSEAVSKLDVASGRLQSLERNILQYAEKLGLTPSGRVRLAQRRAAQVKDVNDDSDLYGD